MSKTEVRKFMIGMNQYLFASPPARRQMIKAWEEDFHSSMTKRMGKKHSNTASPPERDC
ncbi:hypothetical protein [Xanthomonas theicola]|uniref:hypothetical protein n=1 Tax=Xanthomonas theicola TaxID=56464 RepID=UPI001304F19E|nr:hypothetical protein [Xanthomonas theicola]QNH25229.1 hypothetical protein G4Q83_11440 [Xanthomonas theicola]